MARFCWEEASANPPKSAQSVVKSEPHRTPTVGVTGSVKSGDFVTPSAAVEPSEPGYAVVSPLGLPVSIPHRALLVAPRSNFKSNCATREWMQSFREIVVADYVPRKR